MTIKDDLTPKGEVFERPSAMPAKSTPCKLLDSGENIASVYALFETQSSRNNGVIMARKTLAERRSDALSELEMAKARLAKLDNEAAERIGRIAIKSGLVNLELTDDQVREEFDRIVERISKGN
ncbi:TraC family protein [Pseudomonas aeruginosa]|nr:TraC family protein [Brucella intermedia]